MEEFFVVGYEYYHKRKDLLMDKVQAESEKLKNSVCALHCIQRDLGSDKFLGIFGLQRRRISAQPPSPEALCAIRVVCSALSSWGFFPVAKFFPPRIFSS